MEKKRMVGLQKAIQSVGDVPRFARAIGVTNKVVLNWLAEDGAEVPEALRPQGNSVSKAIEQAGSQAALARELKVSTQSIGIWLRQGHVPLQRAQQIELIYGIPRGELVSPKVRNAMGIGGDL